MSALKVWDYINNVWVKLPAGGVGVPSGGTAGQVLAKSSNTDYAAEWVSKGITLLWTNPSPTDEFAATTLNISISGYDFIAVEHKCYATLDQFRIDYGAVGTAFGLIHPTSGGGYGTAASVQNANRKCDATNTAQIAFSDAYNTTGTAAWSKLNTRCIPYRIYGIKF